MAFVTASILSALAIDTNKILITPESSAWFEDEHYSSQAADDSQWWQRFGDSTLDSLVNLAMERNYDLRMAARRIEIARKAVSQTQSAYYPQIGMNAGWTRTRQAGAIQGHDTPAAITSYWNAGLSMSWEIDVFGKITAQAKKGKTMVNVSRAEFAAAMVSLQAEIATTYINLRVAQAQLEIAHSHSKSQLDVVHITEARHKAGLASMLDVAQSKTVYYSTIASIPMLDKSVRAYINSIAVLIDEYPDNLYTTLAATKALPAYNQIVSVGTKLDLINRRPDIVEARLNVIAAAEALGIARKDYLPSLTVTGSIGTSAHDAGDLFKDNSFTYTIAPTLSWQLFDGFARRGATASAKIELENQVDNYNLAVMSAVQEVDNAMSSYTSELKYLTSIEEVVKQSEESERLSIDLYKKGLSPFTNVADGQLNVLGYRNTLVSAQGDAIVALINLYKALGGGWTDNID